MSQQLTEENFLLDIRNLQTCFPHEEGSFKATDNISFRLKKGETIGIVGESGSGKSVTALSIMGLIQKTHGTTVEGNIFFNTPSRGIIDLNKLSQEELQQERGNEISMVFQEPMTSLNPVFTCGDQIRETILAHRKNISKKEAYNLTIELFEKVQLPRPVDMYNAYPHQISGGQKQRVMIAMAMCCNPSVLIADEPTTALDVTVQARILDLMRKLRDENNMSIIFITHDLGVVSEIADYLIVMYQGKIVEQGHIYDVFSNPQHPYTKGLLACRPRLDMKLKVLPVVSDFMAIDNKGVITERQRQSVVDALIDNIVIDEDIKAERRKKRENVEPLLVVKNLKTYFSNKRSFFGKTSEYIKAVDDISFEVYPGETLGLVGESGCGKTTLGRSILRLIEPTEGQIIFEGEDITHVKAERLRALRKDMQIIFQDPYSSLNPRITIGEAIIEPMRINGIGDSDYQRVKKAIALLERVNLSASHFNRYPHEFSGGQRQRICIARALGVSPKFIVCDESVSALDVSVQAQVLNLLNELKEEFKFTNIFISHDLSVVKFISDRIIVMNKGKIVEQNDADDLYSAPQSDYTRMLISSIPQIDFDALRKKRTSLKQGNIFQ